MEFEKDEDNQNSSSDESESGIEKIKDNHKEESFGFEQHLQDYKRKKWMKILEIIPKDL